jgi:Domain of unknown function (DUF5666)
VFTVSHLRFSFKRLLITLLSTAMLVGSLVAAVRTGGTGLAVEYGEIEGFGSIIVNGVHYDERAANIIINGAPNQPRHLLELGMIVEVQGTVDAARTTGVANTVIVNRTLVGEVQSVDLAKGEFTVLNQRVRPSTTVQIVGVSQNSTIRPGLFVGIYGLHDATTGGVIATRLEGLDSAPQSLIRGTVTRLSATQFNIGSLVVSRANATVSNGSHLENGAFVEAAGVFDAAQSTLRPETIKVTKEVEGAEGADTELTGYVAGFQSLSGFTLAGVTVDASGAKFENGTAAELTNGRKVGAEGHFMGGVLMAENIQFKDVVQPIQQEKQRAVELEGRISQYRSVVDFSLRGYTIDASDASIDMPRGFGGGLNTHVHVKGVLLANGVVKARSVRYER